MLVSTSCQSVVNRTYIPILVVIIMAQTWSLPCVLHPQQDGRRWEMCRYHSWGAAEDGSFEGSSCEANIKSIIENIAAINIEYEFLLWLWGGGRNGLIIFCVAGFLDIFHYQYQWPRSPPFTNLVIERQSTLSKLHRLLPLSVSPSLAAK